MSEGVHFFNFRGVYTFFEFKGGTPGTSQVISFVFYKLLFNEETFLASLGKKDDICESAMAKPSIANFSVTCQPPVDDDEDDDDLYENVYSRFCEKERKEKQSKFLNLVFLQTGP